MKRYTTQGLAYTQDPLMDNYMDLLAAIVSQAVDDYIECLTGDGWKTSSKPVTYFGSEAGKNQIEFCIRTNPIFYMIDVDTFVKGCYNRIAERT